MKLIDKAQEDKTVLILLSLVCFLIGLVVGFFLSPVKKGVKIGCNNTLTADNDDDDELTDDDDDIIKF